MQGRSLRDPDAQSLRPGRVEAVQIDTDEPLAIYMGADPSSDYRFPLDDRYCSAISTDLGITVADRRHFSRIDDEIFWIRLAYLEVPTSGVYELTCIELQGRSYAIASAELGNGLVDFLTDLMIRAGGLVAIGVPIAGVVYVRNAIKRNRRSQAESGGTDEVSLIR